MFWWDTARYFILPTANPPDPGLASLPTVAVQIVLAAH